MYVRNRIENLGLWREIISVPKFKAQGLISLKTYLILNVCPTLSALSGKLFKALNLSTVVPNCLEIRHNVSPGFTTYELLAGIGIGFGNPGGGVDVLGLGLGL